MLQFRQVLVQIAGASAMVVAIIALAAAHACAKGPHGGGHHGGGHHGGGHHAGRHHGGHHGRAHHGGNHLGGVHHAGRHQHHALARHSHFGKGRSASRPVSATHFHGSRGHGGFSHHSRVADRARAFHHKSVGGWHARGLSVGSRGNNNGRGGWRGIVFNLARYRRGYGNSYIGSHGYGLGWRHGRLVWVYVPQVGWMRVPLRVARRNWY